MTASGADLALKVRGLQLRRAPRARARVRGPICPMKDWKVAEVVGFVSATAFALTIVFLYGYSIPLHFIIFKYLTITDYLRLAVVWLVPTAIFWIAAVPFEAFLRRTEHGATEAQIGEKIAKARHPRFRLWFRRGGLRAPFVAAEIAAVVAAFELLLPHFPKISSYQILEGTSPFVWWEGVRWYERVRRLVAEWTAAWRAWVWFFPAVLLFSFFRGLSTAERVRTSPTSAATTRIFVLGRPDPTPGQVLFVLDDYILLRTSKDGEVEAIPKAQISMIVEGKPDGFR
jgi:hypothetical protein